VVSTWRRELSH